MLILFDIFHLMNCASKLDELRDARLVDLQFWNKELQESINSLLKEGPLSSIRQMHPMSFALFVNEMIHALNKRRTAHWRSVRQEADRSLLHTK